jgi:hypothetical protein
MEPLYPPPANIGPKLWTLGRLARAEAYRDKLNAFAEITGQVIGAAFPIPPEMARDWTQAFTAFLVSPQDDFIQHLRDKPEDFEPYYEDPPPFDPNELADAEEEAEQLRRGLSEIDEAETSDDAAIQGLARTGMLTMMRSLMTRNLRICEANIREIQSMMEISARETMSKETPDLARSAMPTPLDELNKRGIIKPGDDVGRL